MLKALAELDRTLFLVINQGTRNRFFDWAMPLFSGEHYAWVLLAAAAVWILAKGKARSRFALVALLLVFALGDVVSTYLLKPFFGRPRPYSTMDDIMVYKWGAWSAAKFIKQHHTLSFPSNHAVNSVAAATVVIHFFPRWRLAAALLAFLVCYSRVYMGQHYPADVLAGALVGLACAGLYFVLENRLVETWPRRFSWLSKEASS